MVLETGVCFQGVLVTAGVSFSFLSSHQTECLCVYKPVCLGTSMNLSIYNQLHLC